MSDKATPDQQAAGAGPVVAYGAGAPDPGGRWGRVSCRRAALAFLLLVYIIFFVEGRSPLDVVRCALFYPLLLTVCVIGGAYGLRGLRRDQRRRAAVWGLALNSLLGAAALPRTLELAGELLAAYRYNHGIFMRPNFKSGWHMGS